jgi:hypothetical protein
LAVAPPCASARGSPSIATRTADPSRDASRPPGRRRCRSRTRRD